MLRAGAIARSSRPNMFRTNSKVLTDACMMISNMVENMICVATGGLFRAGFTMLDTWWELVSEAQ